MKLSGQLHPVLRRVIVKHTYKFQAAHPARALSFTTTQTPHPHRPSPRSPLQPSKSIESISIHQSYSTSSHKPSPQNMEASDSTTKPESNTQAQPATNPASLPALPPAGEASDSSTLEVGGAAVRLDHLGPLVVNEDGTMSRITNWEKMADIERENTLRICKLT
ncbi:hypothetical protein F5Y08DRAFT_250302 [Xylaria arbuscula]|nr:hypothetical protein F5Y08DRAFT_250302 [Xylaria arbuscula]